MSLSMRKSSFSQRLRSMSFTSSSSASVSPTHLTLGQVLQDKALKEQFRAHLCALHTVEAIDFIDEVEDFMRNPCKDTATRIIAQFCLDGSPQQVNLMCETKAELRKWFEGLDAWPLKHDMFSKSHEEVVRDLRQSDAFRSFLH